VGSPKAIRLEDCEKMVTKTTGAREARDGARKLPAAVLDPSGQASPAERQPCRTAGASFTAARARGRGRRRA
jgi:hypothetical protein